MFLQMVSWKKNSKKNFSTLKKKINQHSFFLFWQLVLTLLKDFPVLFYVSVTQNASVSREEGPPQLRCMQKKEKKRGFIKGNSVCVTWSVLWNISILSALNASSSSEEL